MPEHRLFQEFRPRRPVRRRQLPLPEQIERDYQAVLARLDWLLGIDDKDR